MKWGSLLLICVILLFPAYLIIKRALTPNILFSHAEGTVLKDGKPVEGAVLRFEISGTKEIYEIARLETDQNGHFTLPEYSEAPNIMHFFPIPGEITILQFIHIDYNGKTYKKAWSNIRRNYLADHDINNPAYDPPKKLKFICDLDYEPAMQGDDWTICRLED